LAEHRIHRQRDAPSFRELHRVVDQVFQCGAQADRVADHQRRQLVRNIDLGLQTFCRRAPRKRIAGVARQHPQIEEILPHAGRGVAALCSIDEQCRKTGEMFRTSLDGIDPAPLPLVKVGCRQETAEGQNSGERRAHLMRERRERCLDDTGRGRHGSALARLVRGNAGSAFFRRPPFRRPRGAL
jgi:hypothetical protein